MKPVMDVFVFGEVLFDVFPAGEQILGGAPFNVAWHLQALGDRPQFISRVGDDEPGRRILQAMADWGMDTAGIQVDPVHVTGRVQVEFIDNQPHYRIVPQCAYDFISAARVPVPAGGGILYHGTLGLRHRVSREALMQLLRHNSLAVFLDVNLRSPWWREKDVQSWLEVARWVKLNLEELRLLGFSAADPEAALAAFHARFQSEQVILTCGEEGALVRTCHGEFQRIASDRTLPLVDTVGAGDAFSAVFIHGLRAGWSVAETLAAAQRFAGKVVGLRGATTAEPAFYRNFLETCR